MAFKRVEFGPGYGYEQGESNLPAIIVVQEWWGVTDPIKCLAEKLAATGPYRVLIPDLYKGKIGVDAEEASHLMGNLDFQAAAKEIGAAAQYLRTSGSPKVGVIGFCMGGALTLAAGSIVPELDALVPCYGIPDARYFKVENIKAPTFGVFAENDKNVDFSGPEVAKATMAKVNGAGGNMQLHIVPGGVHGLFNQLTPGGVEMVQKVHGATAPQAEVELAWDKIVAFFKPHLSA